MSDRKYILSIDQGTTSTLCSLFDREGKLVGGAREDHAQIYPRPGWVEHDAEEIWNRVRDAIFNLLRKASVDASELVAIGVANQRETVVIWDRDTGKPICNAIVWQCTRTREFCDQWAAMPGWPEKVRDITGLVINPYFSGTKIRWLLDNVPDARKRAEQGRLLVGTIDSWLVWNLTGGIHGGVHVTDVTNASRTLCMDLRSRQWNKEIINFLNIPMSMFPEIRPSCAAYGTTAQSSPVGLGIPVAGMLGDQQAALFGQACFEPGDVKNTYGTGCFMLMNVGDKPVASSYGLLSTAAYSLSGDHCRYAFEGSIAMGGATIGWLCDGLRLLDDAADCEYFAAKAGDNGGVYFVPAFSGLFAPHWDMSARGVVAGLTHYARKEHIVRAALESICFQSWDVFEAMRADAGFSPAALRVDGGAVKNNLLMQIQADILGIEVIRPAIDETTALGAAYAAGLTVGFWRSLEELRDNWQASRRFAPSDDIEARDKMRAGWRRAIEKSRNWQ